MTSAVASRASAIVAIALLSGCATSRPAPLDVSQPPIRSVEERLADADALAARGCYLCLQEAAEAYAQLVSTTDNPIALRKAVENDLMLAIREIELRLPDSGARGRAWAVRQHVTANYAAYFEALDALGTPLATGGTSRAEIERQRAERREIATRLEAHWPASAMRAYFYLAMALNAGQVAELKPRLDPMLDTHSHDLSLRYRVQAFLPTFSPRGSRALLEDEPRFAEVHFLLGQRAIMDAELVTAHGELTRAHEMLPESASIALVLGNTDLMFARYRESLVLFDRALAVHPDDQGALIGRAKALSYLKRHQEALGILDELLEDVRNNPGEKYYWRAWNRLQTGASQPAYEDATTALKVIANSDVYRLAGMASYSTERLAEARRYFEESLKMNAADCDSLRYLGQIDSVERNWKAAFPQFARAADCYNEAIIRMSAEVAEKEADTTGLLAGQVASLRADIETAQSLLDTSSNNAQVTARNAGIAAP